METEFPSSFQSKQFKRIVIKEIGARNNSFLVPFLAQGKELFPCSILAQGEMAGLTNLAQGRIIINNSFLVPFLAQGGIIDNNFFHVPFLAQGNEL